MGEHRKEVGATRRPRQPASAQAASRGATPEDVQSHMDIINAKRDVSSKNTRNWALLDRALLDLNPRMPEKRKATHHFHQTLRDLRLARKMVQTDFESSSSQKYISELERQLKAPSLAKIEELSESLSVHPLTMLVNSYLNKSEIESLHALKEMIESELKALELIGTPEKPAVRPPPRPRG